jgi:hypothetical protein
MMEKKKVWVIVEDLPSSRTSMIASLEGGTCLLRSADAVSRI